MLVMSALLAALTVAGRAVSCRPPPSLCHPLTEKNKRTMNQSASGHLPPLPPGPRPVRAHASRAMKRMLSAPSTVYATVTQKKVK